MEDYYKHIMLPNRDRLDYVIVEECSLATTLRDDRDALAAYLSPLVDGYIAPGTIGYVIALTGWFVVSFEFRDEHNEEFTVLYLTPTPVGTRMNPDGMSFNQLNYTTIN
jgi:hypothetical protein